jgi:hypothetical protein
MPDLMQITKKKKKKKTKTKTKTNQKTNKQTNKKFNSNSKTEPETETETEKQNQTCEAVPAPLGAIIQRTWRTLLSGHKVWKVVHEAFDFVEEFLRVDKVKREACKPVGLRVKGAPFGPSEMARRLLVVSLP